MWTIEQFKNIADNHQAEKIDGRLIDAQTAHLAVQVYESMSDESKVKAHKISAPRFAALCWAVFNK